MASSKRVTLKRLPNGLSDQTFGGPKNQATTPRILPMFGMGRTAGHVLYSWQQAAKAVSIWPLVLEVTLNEATTLSELYHRHLKGPSEQFDYRHTDGVGYTDVRWVDEEFGCRRIDKDTYEVNLTLQIEDVHIGDSANTIL